jgi:hypothetical protein
MSLYYDSDLDKDLKQLEDQPLTETLDQIGKLIGYGRAQQIMQVLWARQLREKGYPTSGALFRD